MKEALFLALKYQIQALASVAVLKEHSAPWLGNSLETSILRDAMGRFAAKPSASEPTAISRAKHLERLRYSKGKFLLLDQKEIASLGIEPKALSDRLEVERENTPTPEDIPNLQRQIDANNQKINQLLVDIIAVYPKAPNEEKTKLVVENNRQIVELKTQNEVLEAKIYQAQGKGFSLTKRVKELVDIAQAEGVESPRYKWRKLAIDAELKYGAILDSVGKEGNDRLLKKLTKFNTPAANYQGASESDIKFLEKGLAGIMNKPETPKEYFPYILEVSKQAGFELQKLLNRKIDVRVGIVASRSCSLAGSQTAVAKLVEKFYPTQAMLDFWKEKADGFINIGDVAIQSGTGLWFEGQNPTASMEDHFREIIWHETGHLIEENCDFMDTSVAFREDRGKETLPDDKITGFIWGETTKDRFYHPYVGLHYDVNSDGEKKPIATEVLSSGFEALASDSLIKKVVVMDREHLLYTIGAMDAAK